MTATKTTGGCGVGKPAPAGASPNADWMNPDEIAAYARRPVKRVREAFQLRQITGRNDGTDRRPRYFASRHAIDLWLQRDIIRAL